MTCRAIQPLLGSFNDGELGTEKVLEVEQHVAECELCSERLRLIHAMRLSVRRVVQEKAQPSPAFKARLAAALEAAHQREWEARVLDRQIDRSRMLSWRTILPVAAAASLTLVWAASTDMEPKARTSSGNYHTADASGVDQVLEDLVDYHVRSTPDVTEPKLLPTLASEEVGVPVHVPSLAQYGARWVSGTVVPVRNQRAALLRYKLGNQRFTVYVYDSSRVPIGGGLQQRYVGDEPVYVGKRRGYSIGVANRGRVGYAVASDMNDAETAEIVARLDP